MWRDVRVPPLPNRHSCESRNPSLGRGGGPAPSPPTPQPSFLRRQESIPGARGSAPPHLPPLGTRFRGHDGTPTVIPAKLVLVETGSRNPSLERGGAPPPHSPPLGTRVRGHDDAPTIIPAKLVLVETGSRNPSLAGRAAGPSPKVRGPLSSVGVAAVGLGRGGLRAAPTLGYVSRLSVILPLGGCVAALHQHHASRHARDYQYQDGHQPYREPAALINRGRGRWRRCGRWRRGCRWFRRGCWFRRRRWDRRCRWGWEEWPPPPLTGPAWRSGRTGRLR